MRRWKRSGVDIAIDISNASEGAREAASLTRYGGKVFLAGTPTENRVILNAIEARDKELSIQFVRRPHDTFERAVELLRNGNLGDVSRIITHRLPMDNVAEAYRIIRKYDEEALKVVIEMPGYESKAE